MTGNFAMEGGEAIGMNINALYIFNN